MGELIYISRDGSKVVVNFATGLPHEDKDSTTLITTERDVEHVYLAELLARHLREQLRTALHDAREEAYNEGWKDAKAHKAKRNWFSGLLMK